MNKSQKCFKKRQVPWQQIRNTVSNEEFKKCNSLLNWKTMESEAKRTNNSEKGKWRKSSVYYFSYSPHKNSSFFYWNLGRNVKVPLLAQGNPFLIFHYVRGDTVMSLADCSGKRYLKSQRVFLTDLLWKLWGRFGAILPAKFVTV